ncbi:uncharacterized protein FOMMEDRAFT_16754 [Fomitiporia mediterranea MF3/22]|uniref:uncharacterized protein n=1 Tax=Fomitiporia mediterranea (strain MF3/22) TaxID=694068 RepID=UPI000440989F|nr:uncharacterized protein FOMMEDRAFT_16754 [Fomitiporia mediterranea MF3/22]EJD08368.1 hypothetical protein FOMMEDRAFT_16754 [Fomitiporia mediterranea MF3/22]
MGCQPHLDDHIPPPVSAATANKEGGQALFEGCVLPLVPGTQSKRREASPSTIASRRPYLQKKDIR